MAWLLASASDRDAAPALVIGFAAVHALLWTVILINLKAAQDVHMDVAEAFAWGQKFKLGYGKHPPLAGCCLLYTSPSPRDRTRSRMPSSA